MSNKLDWVEVPAELKKILNKYVGNDNSNKTKKDRLACGSEIMNFLKSELDEVQIEIVREIEEYHKESTELLETTVRELNHYRDALTELVELKEMKDVFGKTEKYLERQPIAWENAFELLGKYPKQAAIDKPLPQT